MTRPRADSPATPASSTPCVKRRPNDTWVVSTAASASSVSSTIAAPVRFK